LHFDKMNQSRLASYLRSHRKRSGLSQREVAHLLGYLFQYLLFRRQNFIEQGQGGAQPNISQEIIRSDSFLLAPLPEQQRIAEKLEKLLANVAGCQKRLVTIPKILKRFRQSVLAAACSGRLTVEWRIQREDAPATGETNAESDDLPPGWRTICVGDVIEDLKYGTSQRCGYEKHGVPVLRIPNVTNGVIDHGDLKFAELPAKEQKQLHLLPGDMLIVRSNGSVSLVGKCALVTEKERGFSYAGYLIRIRPKQAVVSPEFLNLALSSYDVRLQIELEARSTSGVNNINSEEVRALHLSLPPLKEQKEIVQRVNGLFALADKIETRYKTIQRQVDRLPQSILAKAFRGELVHTEAQLAEREGRPYESAAQLLQRIRSLKIDKPAPQRSKSKRTKET
jgi:type I restriction enzyme S subunit